MNYIKLNERTTLRLKHLFSEKIKIEQTIDSVLTTILEINDVDVSENKNLTLSDDFTEILLNKEE